MNKQAKIFNGKWITNSLFANAKITELPDKENKVITENNTPNKHILFRKKFNASDFKKAVIHISADDYYKLYINGKFVGMGPAPAYLHHYYYDTIDVTNYLHQGENTIAFHTYYQGLVNRVWVSGDMRHGLILDLELDGKTVISSDESFKLCEHSGYTASGKCGYDTQFLEDFDSNSREADFYLPDFDDSYWENSVVSKSQIALYKTMIPQLVVEEISAVKCERKNGKIFVDFGSCYIGYLKVVARGNKNDIVTVRCAQELNQDGSVRYKLRAGCDYEEKWTLSGKEDTLDWFDYKSFRYAEFILPENVQILDIKLISRHYPFKLIAKPNTDDENLLKVWDLCVNSLHYGVQEMIMDCMEREKGQYVGDAVYTSSTLAVLTGDTAILEKLIAEAVRSRKFERGMFSCTSCAFAQEIAEYPLMLPWAMCVHYALKKDKAFIAEYIDEMVDMLEYYKERYETNECGLLYDLDKWCVVDWPRESRDGYAVETLQNMQITAGTHNVISAYYIGAIKVVNRLLGILGRMPYRDTTSLIKAFDKAFYDKNRHLYTDSKTSDHTCIPSNVLPVMFGFNADAEFKKIAFILFRERGISNLNIFMTFPLLVVAKQNGDTKLLHQIIGDKNAWLRMIDDGATTTFEAFGKDLKWNTSLFHLAFTYAALFLTDFDDEIFHP